MKRSSRNSNSTRPGAKFYPPYIHAYGPSLALDSRATDPRFEPVIRSAYAKVYDGIAGICLNEKIADIAVEYERTLKSQAKYAKVREAIVSERCVNSFLYLAPSGDLLYGLCREFWRMERLLFFGNVREFKEKALTATVYDTYGRSLSFQDMLLKAIAAKSRT